MSGGLVVDGNPSGSETHEPMLPSFDIPLASVVIIDGRRFYVKECLGDQWVFIDLANERPRFLQSQEIGILCRQGNFAPERSPARGRLKAAPKSPLLVDADDHQKNLRKHDYVRACRDLKEHFRRSRPVLSTVIAEVAERRNEAKPGFTTVLEWLDEEQALSGQYGTAAHTDRHDLKGKRGPRVPNWQQRALEAGVEAWLTSSPRCTIEIAYAKVVEWVREYEKEGGSTIDRANLPAKYVDDAGRLRPPSKRTLERRCEKVDRLTRDHYRRGPRYAAINNRTYSTRSLPKRPYEQVEVDHTRLDILVVDEGGCVFGRPDMIVFRDRATAMILGFSMSFEEPSYVSFLEGLMHATYPKDLERYPAVENPWPCYGRFEKLFVDNALHFIGHNIEEAARELGFDVEILKPRHPWQKGGIERYLQTQNVGLLHTLPGTTLENILARRDHDNLGAATVTLAELEALVTKWICDVYHQSVTRALGEIRGLGDTPIRAWNRLVQKHPVALPPARDLFMSLAGDTDYRTIQKNGITWDHITYEDAQLTAIITNPKHGVRRDGRTSTKYKVIRDPYRLSEISIVDHHTGEIRNIPATEAHLEYASNVVLHQHRVIVARAKEQVNGAVNFEDILRARAQLAEVAQSLRRNRPKKTVRQLARFLQRETSRRLLSRISTVPQTTDTSDFFDFENPVVEVDRAQPIIAATHVGEPGTGIAGPTTGKSKTVASRSLPPSPETTKSADDLSDLEEFRKRKAWSVSDGRDTRS